MTQRIDELKKAWNERQARLGSSKRAVLFKRLPGWLNESIHRRHVKFILDNIPANTNSILDVGCGYGRISSEIKIRKPETRFQGVDLCTEFAAAYERDIGPCFNGPVQEFASDERFDAILIVTTLMYLDVTEHEPVLQRLWAMLNDGGCLICIEPASEMFTLWRRLTGKASASPTGGTVNHFLRKELIAKTAILKGIDSIRTDSVFLVPFLSMAAVHHELAVFKT